MPHKPTAAFLRRRRTDPDDMGWSLTLADMMTLLLCFFVLLLAVAQVDSDKYQAMSSVMAEALGGDEAPSKRQAREAAGVAETPGEVRVEMPGKNLFELQLELARLVGEDREHVGLEMRSDPYSVAISLGDEILFDSGSAELKSRAAALLTRLAGPLAGSDYSLTIEGHTDDRPIHSPVFPSNWELSSARAAAVARYLIAKGFDKDRVRILGLADTEPVAQNDTPEGRQKNRRVVILVQPS